MSPEDHGNVVIAAYRPRAGKEAQLRALAERHIQSLRRANLITDRLGIQLQAIDGTVLEIFEWKSPAAVRQAHEHPSIKPLWDELAQVADMIAPGFVPEMQSRFPHFTPLDGA